MCPAVQDRVNRGLDGLEETEGFLGTLAAMNRLSAFSRINLQTPGKDWRAVLSF
jgi:hypothetical protein